MTTPPKDPQDYLPLGRPTEFRSEYVAEVKKLCALGLTDVQIAQFYDVAPLTIYRWQHAHPEFRKAMVRGKDLADEIVVQSMFKRAVGYAHEAVKIFLPQGASEPVYAPYIEHYPPDAVAIKMWLTNRRPKEWSDKAQVTHEAGPSFAQLVEASLRPKEEKK